MNRSRRQNRPTETRTRIVLAVVTGVFAGISRAVSSWVIDHLTSGN